MDKDTIEMKLFNIRMTKEMWRFLKRNSVENEISMTDIINDLLNNYKKRIENKLSK